MKQKIFDTKNSYDFFTSSRKIVLEEETNTEMDSTSKFGFTLIDTGRFFLLISTELTDQMMDINNDNSKKYPVLLRLVDEKSISDIKYLSFSVIYSPENIPFPIEILLEKPIIVHCLMKLVSSNRDEFPIQKVMKIVGLDLQEFLDFKD